MASVQFEEHLANCGVDATLANTLAINGWSTQTFSMIVNHKDEFTDQIWEALSDEPLTLLQKSGLKVAWQQLQEPTHSQSSSSAFPVQPCQAEGSWTEAFAPKLQTQTMTKLKKQFLSDYPSEVLTWDNMPSSRLLSLAHLQHSRQDYKWIPWRFCMSQSKMDDMLIYQKSKVPKLEGLQLHQLILDEPPALEITNQGIGINGIRSMMEIRNTALALVGSCHLQRLRAYTLKFLGFLSQRLDSESGLRTCNVLEAQSADKSLWHSVCEMVTDQGFTLDNALHEITHLRADMASLLQPRAKAPQRVIPPSLPSFSPSSKGKGKNKGKGKPPQRGGKSGGSDRPTWVTEAVIQGKKVQLCMLWQSGKCQKADQCKFGHYCAFPLASGQACAQTHSAFDHQRQPH